MAPGRDVNQCKHCSSERANRLRTPEKDTSPSVILDMKVPRRQRMHMVTLCTQSTQLYTSVRSPLCDILRCSIARRQRMHMVTMHTKHTAMYQRTRSCAKLLCSIRKAFASAHAQSHICTQDTPLYTAVRAPPCDMLPCSIRSVMLYKNWPQAHCSKGLRYAHA